MERNYNEILEKLEKEAINWWTDLKFVNFWLENKEKVNQLLIKFIEKMDDIEDDPKPPKDVFLFPAYYRNNTGSWKIWNNLKTMILRPESEEIKNILNKYAYYRDDDIKGIVKEERKKLLQIAEDIYKNKNHSENEYRKAQLAKLLSQSYRDQMARFELNWEHLKTYVRKVEYSLDYDIKYYYFEDVKEEQIIVDVWKELISQ